MIRFFLQLDSFLKEYWEDYYDYYSSDTETDCWLSDFSQKYASMLDVIDKTTCAFPDLAMISTKKVAAPTATTQPVAVTPTKKLSDSEVAFLKTLKSVDELKVNICIILSIDMFTSLSLLCVAIC